MALAKEPVQAYSYYNNMHEEPSIQASDHLIDTVGFESYQKMVGEEVLGPEELDGPMKNFSSSHVPSLANLNSTNFVFRTSNSPSEEAHSLLNFKSNNKWDSTNGSLLSFDRGECISHPTNYSEIGHEEDYLSWASAMDNKYGCNYTNSKCSRPMEDMNYETTSSNSLMKNIKDNQCSDERYGWLFSEDGIQDSGVSQGCFQKRPHMECYFSNDGEVQEVKKHCAGGDSRKSKAKTIPSKDPQSMAAKQRRERINERLKILQDLVPNGSKVDLVTMLEKAISYVKFLQLQVKVLATDEFWPAQGGKAPEVAQVKEAIDAIISSYRDRSSSSK